MVLTGRPGKDDENAYVYFWKEKAVSKVAPNGTLVDFTIDAAPVATVTLINTSNLGTVPNGDKFVADASGRYKYIHYDTDWKETVGNRASYDVTVYFRKNGIDYLVDGNEYDIAKGGTYWEAQFDKAPTEAIADEVLISYSYSDSAKPAATKLCVVDFNPKSNGGDFEVEQCIGNTTYKRRTALELIEVSLTTKKRGNDMSQSIYGDRTIDSSSWANTIVRNVTGGNKITNRTVVISVQDPEDSTNVFYTIFRNAGLTSADFNGGVDSAFEESLVLKTEPYNYIEIESDK